MFELVSDGKQHFILITFLLCSIFCDAQEIEGLGLAAIKLDDKFVVCPGVEYTYVIVKPYYQEQCPVTWSSWEVIGGTKVSQNSYSVNVVWDNTNVPMSISVWYSIGLGEGGVACPTGGGENVFAEVILEPSPPEPSSVSIDENLCAGESLNLTSNSSGFEFLWERSIDGAWDPLAITVEQNYFTNLPLAIGSTVQYRYKTRRQYCPSIISQTYGYSNSATIYPPPPSMVSVDAIAPICTVEDGSILINHADVIAGVNYVYTITSYPSSSETCDIGDEFNQGDEQTCGGPVSSAITPPEGKYYCSNSMWNYEHTFSNSGNQSLQLFTGTSVELGTMESFPNELYLVPGVYEIVVEVSGVNLPCFCRFYVVIPELPARPVFTSPQVTLPSCSSGTDGSVMVGLESIRGSYSSDYDISYTLRNGEVVYNGLVDDLDATNKFSISGLTSGNYELTVSDICASVDTLELPITIDSSPEFLLKAEAFNEGQITCVTALGTDGKITLEATDVAGKSYTFRLEDGEGNEMTSNGSSHKHVFENLSSGEYTVSASIGNGCEHAVSGIKLLAPSTLSGSLFHTDLACSTISDGSIEVTGINKTAGEIKYSYKLMQSGSEVASGEDETSSILTVSSLGAGTYQLTVIDRCLNDDVLIEETVVINNPPLLSYESIETINPECSNSKDGSIVVENIDKEEGEVLYSYTLTQDGSEIFFLSNVSNPGDIEISSDLQEGTYHLLMIDHCVDDAVFLDTPVIIDSPDKISVATTDDVLSLICYEDKTDVVVNVTSPTASFMLDVTMNGSSIEGYPKIHLSPGSHAIENLSVDNDFPYQVIVTEECETAVTDAISTLDIHVNSNANAQLSASFEKAVKSHGYDLSCHGGSDGVVNVLISGGVQFADAMPYRVEVLNGSTVLLDNRNLVSDDPDGTISTGQVEGSSVRFEISGLTAGVDYTLRISDGNSPSACEVEELHVGYMTYPPQVTIQSPDMSEDFLHEVIYNGALYVKCKTETVNYRARMQGGSAPYVADLYYGLTQDAIGDFPIGSKAVEENTNTDGIVDGEIYFDELQGGWYEVRVRDQFGCAQQEVQSFEVRESEDPLSVTFEADEFVHGHNTSCRDTDDAEIFIEASGGLGTYSFFLDGDDGSHREILAKNASTHLFSNLSAHDASEESITYTVTVIDALGCEWSPLDETEQEITLSAPEEVLFSVSIVSPVQNGYEILCRGDAATIEVEAEGGAPGYVFLVDGESLHDTNDANAFDHFEMYAGEYAVHVQDALGCPSPTQTLTIDEPSASVTVDVVNITSPPCIGGTDGAIVVEAAGGIAGQMGEEYTFEIKTLEALDFETEILQGIQPTFLKPANDYSSQSYVIKATDSHGCSAEVNAEVHPTSTPLTLAVEDVTDPSCHAATNGSVQVSASNYTGSTLRFMITGGGYGSSIMEYESNSATFTYTGLEDTYLEGETYTVWVADGNNCEMIAEQYVSSISLLSPSALEATLSLGHPRRPTCYAGSDGSIEVTLSGGVGPYQYSLDNETYFSVGAENRVLVSGLVTGDYTIYVRDAQYDAMQPTCQLSNNYNVGEGRTFTFTGSIEPVTCKGGTDGSVDVTVTVQNHNYGEENEPLTYEWINENISSSVFSVEEDQYNLRAGSYLVRAQYTECRAEKKFVVKEPASAYRIADVQTYQASCGTAANGVAIVTVTGGWPGALRYYRLDGGGWQAFNGSSFALTGLEARTYHVEISEGAMKNCVASAEFEITRATLSIAVSNLQSPSCPGSHDGVIILNTPLSNGDVEYALVGGSFQSSPVFSGLSAGSYWFEAKRISVSGCESQALEVMVSDPEDCGNGPLQGHVASINDATCATSEDGTAEVIAYGGVPPYRYYWNGSVEATEAVATGLSSGEHVVEVRDAVDASYIVHIAINTLAEITLQSFTTLTSCADSCDGSATVVASGGSGDYSIEWEEGLTGSFTPVSLCAGSHTFTVHDNRNPVCSVSSAVEIDHHPSLTIENFITQSPTCSQGANGEINITVTGGSGVYTYQWSNGGSQAKASHLTAGAYSVTVTDANLGCSASGSFTITDPAPILVSTTTTSPLCHGASNGSAELVIENAVSPLVVWSTGKTGLKASGLSAGSYTYTVKSSNGCMASGSAAIEDREALVVTSSTTPTSCNGYCDGSASLVVSGGSSPYQVTWSHGPKSLNVKNLCAGTYSYTVKDRYNCAVSQSVTILQPTTLEISSSKTDPGCYGGKDGVLSVTASGGNGGYVYEWAGRQETSASITSLGRGQYTAVVKDSKGCAVSRTITLSEPSRLRVLSEQAIMPSCNGDSDGSIAVQMTGGTSPYHYVWSNGGESSSLIDLSEGDYQLQVTDAKGCPLTRSYALTSPESLVLAGVVVNDLKCYADKSGRISFTASGGVAPYQISWSNGLQGWSIDGLDAGLHSAVITDAKGCQLTKEFNLTQPLPLELSGIASEVTICSESKATVTPEGKWSGYEWRGPGGFFSSAPKVELSTGGNYTLTVFNDTNCSVSQSFTIHVDVNELRSDFLRISEAVIFEPIVFVDISVPVAEQTEWLIPEDSDITINKETNSMIELVFSRTGDFEIGIRGRTGICYSTLYKTVTILDADEREDEGGRISTEKEDPVEITVFPNPMRDVLTVQLSVPDREPVHVRLLSGLDNKELATTTLQGQHDYYVHWELPAIPSGVHHLMYEYKDQVFFKRILVIR